jgi:hypothetical protein
MKDSLTKKKVDCTGHNYRWTESWLLRQNTRYGIHKVGGQKVVKLEIGKHFGKKFQLSLFWFDMGCIGKV